MRKLNLKTSRKIILGIGYLAGIRSLNFVLISTTLLLTIYATPSAGQVKSNSTSATTFEQVLLQTETFLYQNFDSLAHYATQLVAVADTNNVMQLSTAYYWRGVAQMTQTKFAQARTDFEQSLAFAEAVNCTDCKVKVLAEMAVLAASMGWWFDDGADHLQVALEYILEAEKHLSDETDTLTKVKFLNTKGMVDYYRNEDPVTILRLIEEAEKLLPSAKSFRTERWQQNLMLNRGFVANNEGDYAKSVEIYKTLLPQIDTIQNGHLAYLSQLNIVEPLLATEGEAAAYDYTMRALATAERMGNRWGMSYIYEMLHEYFAEAKNYPAAYEALQNLYDLETSMFHLDRELAVSEMDRRYLTSIKEARILEQELALERANSQRNLLVIIGLFILSILSGIFFYFRKKKKKRQLAAEQALQLEQARAEQLAELDHLKSNFFANISHEFRTPLSVIISPLQQLQRGEFNGNLAQYYDLMLRNAQRLQQLINQILDLSKVESGKLVLETEAGDLSAFLRRVAGTLESLGVRRQIDFSIQVTDKITPVFFDLDKLEKIFTNLLSNAFKFTPKYGKVQFLTEVKIEKTQTFLTVHIANSGASLSPTEIASIFDRFYQNQSAEDGSVGSGIGLALVKELVELHDGTIEVDSNSEWTTFTVQLAFANADLQQISTTANALTVINTAPLFAETPAEQTTDKPSLLLVEDNPDVRFYIKDLLKDQYEILAAEDGEIGWEIATKRLPDLIVTDVMMPKLNGTELAQRLKTDVRTSHIPIIMLTAKAEQHDKLAGLETGADAYVIKPFDAQELQLRIQKLIEQRRLLQQKFATQKVLAPSEIAVTSADEKFLEQLVQFIEIQMDNEQLTIEELAAAAHLSRSQWHRKIKALTGQSPSVFLRTIRL
ncbi:MAG: response regulator, partial [Saprospiraceae bacterium]